MTGDLDYVFLETHNWGKAVKFWQELGFRLELDRGHSGRLVHPDGGSAIFVEEVPDRPLGTQLYPRASNVDSIPGSPVEVASDWHRSHWGTNLLELRDPDGRSITMQHGPEAE